MRQRRLNRPEPLMYGEFGRRGGLETVAIVSLALGGATAGVSAMAASSAAKSQNKMIQDQMLLARRQEAAQKEQMSEVAKLEKDKVVNVTETALARLRVAGGEQGVGLEGSFNALALEQVFNMSLEHAIMDRNLAMNTRAAGFQMNQQLLGLQRQEVDPGAAAFTAGLEGLATGLAIGGGIGDLAQGFGGSQGSGLPGPEEFIGIGHKT
jgi:hypothetical protein